PALEGHADALQLAGDLFTVVGDQHRLLGGAAVKNPESAHGLASCNCVGTATLSGIRARQPCAGAGRSRPPGSGFSVSPPGGTGPVRIPAGSRTPPRSEEHTSEL